MGDQGDPVPPRDFKPGYAAGTHPSGSSRTLVRAVLFVILALLVIAILYDRQVARPAVDKAWAAIEELSDNSGAKVLTNEDVHSALNRQPSQVKPDGDYTIEVYSYRAGLPWRTHNYSVVYTGKDTLVFTTHFKFEDVSMSTFAPPVVHTPGADVVPGGGGPPSGPGGGGPPSGDDDDAGDPGEGARRPPSDDSDDTGKAGDTGDTGEAGAESSDDASVVSPEKAPPETADKSGPSKPPTDAP